MKTIREALRKKIRENKKILGIDQRVLGKTLGMTQGNVSKLLRGEVPLTEEKILHLCQLLGLTWQELALETDENSQVKKLQARVAELEGLPDEVFAFLEQTVNGLNKIKEQWKIPSQTGTHEIPAPYQDASPPGPGSESVVQKEKPTQQPANQMAESD
jgi:transcriptional regulator with XRE-family HTH domain